VNGLREFLILNYEGSRDADSDLQTRDCAKRALDMGARCLHRFNLRGSMCSEIRVLIAMLGPKRRERRAPGAHLDTPTNLGAQPELIPMIISARLI